MMLSGQQRGEIAHLYRNTPNGTWPGLDTSIWNSWPSQRPPLPASRSVVQASESSENSVMPTELA
jgi:hypothetical protein